MTRLRTCAHLLLISWLALGVTGCPDDSEPTVPVVGDAGADVAVDAADAVTEDSAPDAAEDAGADPGNDGGAGDGGGPADGGTDTDVSAPLSNGAVADLTAAGSGMDLPFDSAPSPDGTEVYYLSAVGEVHHLFKIDVADPSSPVQLSTDPGFVLPLGLVTDGVDVFVLDTAWEEPDGPGEGGAIFRVPVAGGAATILDGSQGTAPTGATMSPENAQVYFTGEHPDGSGTPAVMSIPSAGGSVTVVSSGAPLVSPSGVAAAYDGTLYVTDHTGFDGGGGIFRVATDGSATPLVGDLVLGQPAGIVISPDETHLVVSAVTNLSETTVIYRVAIGTGAIVNAYSPANVAANRESAGLHCARNAPVCSWANAGDGGDTGQVYVVTLEVAP